MPTANDPQAFGIRFRQAIARKGHGPLGATALAEALSSEFVDGLSVQSVHKWVTGTAVPRPDRLAVLAQWLGVSPHWLRFGPDPEAVKRLGTGADRPPSARDLTRRLQALSEPQREIVVALLVEFEKIPQE